MLLVECGFHSEYWQQGRRMRWSIVANAPLKSLETHYNIVKMFKLLFLTKTIFGIYSSYRFKIVLINITLKFF